VRTLSLTHIPVYILVVHQGSLTDKNRPEHCRPHGIDYLDRKVLVRKVFLLHLEMLWALDFKSIERFKLIALSFKNFGSLILTFHGNGTARSIRISGVRLFATAYRDVICYPTDSVNATSSRAWIDAAAIHAIFISWTICVKNAFRSTRAVRITDIVCRTDAIDGSVLWFALSIGATRIGIARSWRLDDVRFNYIVYNNMFSSNLKLFPHFCRFVISYALMNIDEISTFSLLNLRFFESK
jgi:hypothetical protein